MDDSTPSRFSIFLGATWILLEKFHVAQNSEIGFLFHSRGTMNVPINSFFSRIYIYISFIFCRMFSVMTVIALTRFKMFVRLFWIHGDPKFVPENWLMIIRDTKPSLFKKAMSCVCKPLLNGKRMAVPIRICLSITPS